MLSEFGKFCRKLRMEKNELLIDMAQKLEVKSSFLSAVEVGKKSIPEKWKGDDPSGREHHRGWHRCQDARREDLPLYPEEPGRYHHRDRRRADRRLPGRGGKPQDGRGELRPSDCGCLKPHERKGQKNRLHLKRRQYGYHHHVLRGTVRPDPERPDLHSLHHPSGQARPAGTGGPAHRRGAGQRHQA